MKPKNIFDFFVIAKQLKRAKRQVLIVFLIFDFLFLILAFAPQGANAQEASFYLSPSKGNYKLRENFYVNVLVNVEGIPINAAQAKIYFPSEKLMALEISKAGSIFTLWPEEPTFSNSKGEISFLGGLPTPGFIGKAGKVISILFQAKTQGKAEVSFAQEKILANDPKGTNIFSFSQAASFSIFSPEEFPPEKPPPELPEDTEPPLSFEIIIDNEGDPTNPTPFLYFETQDEISGISHYEVKIGKEDFFEVPRGETTPLRMPFQSPGTYLVIVKAVDKAGNFTESVVEVKIESILIPQITICPDTFRAGEEILFLGGTALPDSQQIIFFEKEDQLIKKWEVFSDGEGDWSIAKEGLFRSGIYKISVQTEDERGVKSSASEPCFVKVILGGIPLGPLILSYKTLTSITLIVLISVLSLVLYLWLRMKKTRKLIERETLDLKRKFYKEYDELRLDVEKELERFKDIKAKRELTKEEEERQQALLKDLADVERVLREELKDIEEIR